MTFLSASGSAERIDRLCQVLIWGAIEYNRTRRIVRHHGQPFAVGLGHQEAVEGSPVVQGKAVYSIYPCKDGRSLNLDAWHDVGAMSGLCCADIVSYPRG